MQVAKKKATSSEVVSFWVLNGIQKEAEASKLLDIHVLNVQCLYIV